MQQRKSREFEQSVATAATATNRKMGDSDLNTFFCATPKNCSGAEVTQKIWHFVADVLGRHPQEIKFWPVTPDLKPDHLRSIVSQFQFDVPTEPYEAICQVIELMFRHQVHTSHPRYFGLFNPAPPGIAIIAESLASAFNPNLANWSNSPFGCEVENHLIRMFGQKIGYPAKKIDGVFTSGGAEANFTSLLAALNRKWPDLRGKGLAAIGKTSPVFYISREGHHSFLKAAGMAGLGRNAVQFVEVDARFRMDARALARRIRADASKGYSPFLVVATAGTTGAGAIDPIPEIHEICKREKLWLHVDAAWGGAIALVPKFLRLLDGIAEADSVTLDPHKWLSMPMGAGMFLTKHRNILQRTFDVKTRYMPTDADGFEVRDPYRRSVQWSRRFIGLPLFTCLLASGWTGFEQMIVHMIEIGAFLRNKLAESGWTVINETELPLVCFFDQNSAVKDLNARVDGVLKDVLASSRAWLSKVCLNGRFPALRACVTNQRTTTGDIEELVEVLRWAREKSSSSLSIGPKT